MARADLSLSEARRIALGAQGFARPRPKGRVDARHLRRLIRETGLLQIDYVNVLLPAQYQVPFSRLGPYSREALDDVVYGSGEFTEQWAHEASILPVETWPLLRHRMERHRVRPWGFEKFLEANAEYVARVRAIVREHAPISSGDLPDPVGPKRIVANWSRSVQRCVLEALFGRGELAVVERLPNFARTYDLPERVLPRAIVRRRVAEEAAQRELLSQAARAHGVATAGDLADYWRLSAKEARPRVAELVEEGELREVRVEGSREPSYLHRAAKVPRRVEAACLLSPFDPLIWTRKRVARLFGFDYRIEIFVPEKKRRWGYYVLPFLMGERLVARVDLKAERQEGCLAVRAAYLEDGADAGSTAEALARELRSLAGWLGLERVRVARKGNLARALSAAARATAEEPPGREPDPAAWHVYVVRCKDGALYTGIALDVGRRVTEHEHGPRGAKSLRGRGPLKVELSREVGDKGRALRVELRIKRMTRAEKEKLIARPGEVERLIAASS